MYRDIPDELRGLIEPVVADHGCELVDAETVVGARSGLLRITIDRVEGDGRVPVESCARISREIEAQLDAADAMSGAYNLEVSSPGLDRVLAREKDFEAACGQDVKLKTRRPVDGRRRFKGRLLEFRAREAVLLVDGQEFRVPFEEVEKANLMYEFSRADFARDKGREEQGRARDRGVTDMGKSRRVKSSATS